MGCSCPAQNDNQAFLTMLALLNKSTPALRSFLTNALPRVSADWWNNCVLRKKVTSLDGLDLAAIQRPRFIMCQSA